ncbi:hypothetical protein GZ78_06400 [Endozoicomonas numazuensis]|uniref:Uncharacterized protein n=1 Tax=Endozoicomonas numazuensis TaxID=1137799 RepID=A0A081NM68_9GAMM|nr:hypothetical protein GZ78_06400 [Endozoicomonas numazuensis]
MSVAGLGSMLIALKLPGWLKKMPARSAILAGGGFIALALITGSTEPSWPLFLLTCLMMGMELSFIQTPARALVNRSCLPRRLLTLRLIFPCPTSAGF